MRINDGVVDVLRVIARELAPSGPDWTTISNISLSIFSLMTAVVSLRLAWRATKISENSLHLGREAIEAESKSERQTRALETQLNCQKLYMEIEEVRMQWRYGTLEEKIRIAESNHVGAFFRRFWTLKSDQFEYWLSGNIEYHTFIGWNLSTARHFSKDSLSDIAGRFYFHSFSCGWAVYGRPYHLDLNPLFVRLTDALYSTFFKSESENRENLPNDDAIRIIDNMLAEIDEINIDANGAARRLGYIETPGDYRIYRTILQNKLPNMFKKYLPDYNPHKFSDTLIERHPPTKIENLNQILNAPEVTPPARP